DDDHEWSRRQKVTRQQRAPQDSHGHHINGDYREKRILHFQADPRPLDSVLFQWRSAPPEQVPPRRERKAPITEVLPAAEAENQHAVAPRRPSTYAWSPQKIRPAAARST